MKHPYWVITASALLVFYGLLLSLVSAPKYETIFITVMICDVVAFTCLFNTARLSRRWLIASVFLGLVALYSLLDVILRAAWGIRFFDLFR